jgi:hypothetical protein
MKAATDIFDSARARILISSLDCARRPQGTARYPLNLRDGTDVRVGGEETLRAWFRRVIGDTDAEDRILDCSVEENFAFFGKLTWRDAQIVQCSFQALITNTDLLTFYFEDGHRVQYYRFDLDPTQPGPLFAEPQPHVHSVPEGPPRFALSFDQREYCLVSFLEFIYRNHYYDKWPTWVKSVSKESVTADQLDDIIASFDNGRVHERVIELSPLLARLANTLRQHKIAQVRRPLTLPTMCAAIVY